MRMAEEAIAQILLEIIHKKEIMKTENGSRKPSLMTDNTMRPDA
jgi:hypothetical protein